MKPEFSIDEANACLALMKQGVARAIDTPNADGAIDTYLFLRDKFRVAEAESRVVAPPPDPPKVDGA